MADSTHYIQLKAAQARTELPLCGRGDLPPRDYSEELVDVMASSSGSCLEKSPHKVTKVTPVGEPVKSKSLELKREPSGGWDIFLIENLRSSKQDG